MAILLRRGFIPDVATSTLLLNQISLFSSSTFAVSSRKINSLYNGFAMNVNRSSDNTQQDIGFLGVDFDASSMHTFVGGGTGVARKWYDQSGNGFHLDGNPNLNQLGVIRNTGVDNTFGTSGKICCVAPGGGLGSMYQSASPGGPTSAPVSFAIVAKFAATNVNVQLVSDGVGSVGGLGSGNSYQVVWGAILQGGTQDTNVHSFIYILNGASSSIYLDGTSIASGNAGTTATGTTWDLWNFGADNVTIAEAIICSGIWTAGDISTIHNDHHTYWGTP